MNLHPDIPCRWVHGWVVDQHKNPSLTGYEQQDGLSSKDIDAEAIEPEDLEPRRIELDSNLGRQIRIKSTKDLREVLSLKIWMNLEKVVAGVSYLQSQMHSEYNSAESTAEGRTVKMENCFWECGNISDSMDGGTMQVHIEVLRSPRGVKPAAVRVKSSSLFGTQKRGQKHTQVDGSTPTQMDSPWEVWRSTDGRRILVGHFMPSATARMVFQQKRKGISSVDRLRQTAIQTHAPLSNRCKTCERAHGDPLGTLSRKLEQYMVLWKVAPPIVHQNLAKLVDMSTCTHEFSKFHVLSSNLVPIMLCLTEFFRFFIYRPRFSWFCFRTKKPWCYSHASCSSPNMVMLTIYRNIVHEHMHKLFYKRFTVVEHWQADHCSTHQFIFRKHRILFNNHHTCTSFVWNDKHIQVDYVIMFLSHSEGRPYLVRIKINSLQELWQWFERVCGRFAYECGCL